RTRGLRVFGPERRQRRVPALRQPARKPPVQLGGEIRFGRAISVPALAPFGFGARAARLRRAPVLERVFRNVERLERWPAEILLGELDLFDAKRRTVRVRRILLVRAAPADMRAHDDQRRPPTLA